MNQDEERESLSKTKRENLKMRLVMKERDRVQEKSKLLLLLESVLEWVEKKGLKRQMESVLSYLRLAKRVLNSLKWILPKEIME